MAGSVLDIPGYREAVAKERLAREASFMPITETVGGFELVSMTLRQFLILSTMRSPLLTNETPTPIDLATFLWLLNPHYTPWGGFHRWLMLRKLRRCVTPPTPLWTSKRITARHERRVNLALFRAAKLVEAVRGYVVETLQDWQPSNSPSGVVMVDHYSDGVAICAAMAREYHWSQEEVLNLPMKRLLQYLKEIRVHNGSKIPLCNPSDHIRAQWLEQVNQRRN